MSTPQTGGRSLLEAVVTALILLGLIIVFYVLGPHAFVFLVAGVVLAAVFELGDALRRSGRKVSFVLTLGGTAALLAAAYRGRTDLFAPIAAALVYASLVLALRPTRGRTPGSDVSWTLLTVFWIGGGGAAATLILMLPDDGIELLIATILIVALADIAAYFVGTTFGKRRLAPSISPGKSWAGVIGGVPAAVLGGAGFGYFIDTLSVSRGLGLGLLCGVLAPAGDLVESLMKRELGIKDSGRLLPGHGGFLDRLDAVLFCAPAAYLYLHAFVIR